MHRKVLRTLLWSSKSQLILDSRDPGPRRAPRPAIPSPIGSIPQGLSTVGRARASDGARRQP